MLQHRHSIKKTDKLMRCKSSLTTWADQQHMNLNGGNEHGNVAHCVQLAAVRIQLEGRWKRFIEEKEKEQELWRKERANNLQNAFFLMPSCKSSLTTWADQLDTTFNGINEGEDESLNFQLAALRMQLKEKQRRFNEKKEREEELWREERAKNLQNAFLLMLKESKLKQCGSLAISTECNDWNEWSSQHSSQNPYGEVKSLSNNVSGCKTSYTVECIKNEMTVKPTVESKIFSSVTPDCGQSFNASDHSTGMNRFQQKDHANMTRESVPLDLNQDHNSNILETKHMIDDTNSVKLNQLLYSSLFSKSEIAPDIPVQFTTGESTSPVRNWSISPEDPLITPFTQSDVPQTSVVCGQLTNNYNGVEVGTVKADKVCIIKGMEIDNDTSCFSSDAKSICGIFESVMTSTTGEPPTQPTFGNNSQLLNSTVDLVLDQGKFPVVASIQHNIQTHDASPETNVNTNTQSSNFENVSCHTEKAPASMVFSIGVDMTECPELTPQQIRKRERFLRQRQKNMPEEKERKAAELSSSTFQVQKKYITGTPKEVPREEVICTLKRTPKKELIGTPKRRSREVCEGGQSLQELQKVLCNLNQETLLNGLGSDLQDAPMTRGKRDAPSPHSPRILLSPTNPSCNLSDEASRYAEYTGPDAYKKPSGNSNRKIIQSAIMHCCLCGEVNKEAKKKCLEAIEKSEANHFLVLFHEGVKFRSVYEYHPDTEVVTRVYGIGPKTINETMMTKYYKYNSGGKEFHLLDTKHLSIQVDGLMIKIELWDKKQGIISRTGVRNKEAFQRQHQT